MCALSTSSAAAPANLPQIDIPLLIYEVNRAGCLAIADKLGDQLIGAWKLVFCVEKP
jgi:hypothetical protein